MLSDLVGIVSFVDEIDVTQSVAEMSGTTSVLHHKVNETCFGLL